MHVGDEVAVMSEQTQHLHDVYGRIIAADADTCLPVVLLLVGGRPLREVVLPLGDILGRRIEAARAGGGREDRIWSGGLYADRRGREWL